MEMLADPLEYTLGYSPLYDIVRVFVIFVGVAILSRIAMMFVTRESKTWITSTKSVIAVYAGLAVTLIIQQVEQFGQELVWWRLPLLLFIGVNALITLWAQQPTRGTEVNRSTTLYLVARAAAEDALCDRDQLSGKLCSNPKHAHSKTRQS